MSLTMELANKYVGASNCLLDNLSKIQFPKEKLQLVYEYTKSLNLKMDNNKKISFTVQYDIDKWAKSFKVVANKDQIHSVSIKYGFQTLSDVIFYVD